MVSGIMILWLLVYHACMMAKISDGLFYKTGLQWLFFFMPWFYFKSGMFYKPESNSSILNYARKRIKTMIIPLLTWFAIGYLVQLIESLVIDNNYKPLWKIVAKPFYRLLLYGEIPNNEPLWFLLSLFFVQILSFYVVKNRNYAIFILLFLAVGYLLEIHSVILPLSASTIPLGLFFYIAGYLYSKYSIEYDSKYFIIAITIFIISNIFF